MLFYCGDRILDANFIQLTWHFYLFIQEKRGVQKFSHQMLTNLNRTPSSAICDLSRCMAVIARRVSFFLVFFATKYFFRLLGFPIFCFWARDECHSNIIIRTKSYTYVFTNILNIFKKNIFVSFLLVTSRLMNY